MPVENVGSTPTRPTKKNRPLKQVVGSRVTGKNNPPPEVSRQPGRGLILAVSILAYAPSVGRPERVAAQGYRLESDHNRGVSSKDRTPRLRGVKGTQKRRRGSRPRTAATYRGSSVGPSTPKIGLGRKPKSSR